MLVKTSSILTEAAFSVLTEAARLMREERYEAAEYLCDEIIKQDELLADAFYMKGNILAHNTRHEEAVDYYRKALEYGHCDDNAISIVKYYFALSLFSIGNYKEGWKNLFTARLLNKNFPTLYESIRRFDKPLFNLQPPPAVVHIHTDGGQGDNFALLRYLPILVEKGYTVRYEAKPQMVGLAQSSFPNIEIVPRSTDFPGISGIKGFDYHLPIVDLPYIFKTELDTIPWNGPYIKPDKELVEKYKLFKGKIGICWSTGLKTTDWYGRQAGHKSLQFDELKPIIDIDPTRFVALQAGEVRLENNRITDCLPRNEHYLTWAETAALVENLDLVISIDTSVAHLAGAMGKPTCLMMHKAITSWQFMAECPNASWNTKSPWYPSLQIYRQKDKGDWGPVISEIVASLGSK
jgi:tetratricopeptide (TPR) repeat protein